MRVDAFVIATCMLLATSPGWVLAQAADPTGGGRGGKGTAGAVVPLAIGGNVGFLPDGSFAPQVDGVDVTGYFGGGGSASRQPRPPQPGGPPAPSIVDFQAFEAELIQT